MAAHWRREGRGHADRLRLWVNGVGGLATAAALAIILVAKFTQGAWLVILVIPLTLAGLLLIRRYYRAIEGGCWPAATARSICASTRRPRC